MTAHGVQDPRLYGYKMSSFDYIQYAATWQGRTSGASRMWLRRALPGVASPYSRVTTNLQEAAAARVQIQARDGQPCRLSGTTGLTHEPENDLEQALTFSPEAAALELFPIWSIPEGIDICALMQPWTISMEIYTAYSGIGALQEHWEIRKFERAVQAVPVVVNDRKGLITRPW